MSKTPIISEEAIDKVLLYFELLEDEKIYEQLFDEFEKEQPYLFAYLYSESTEIFTKEEHEYLISLAIIIWKVVKNNDTSKKDIIDADTIEDIDEQNWEIIEQSASAKFRDKVSPFFENYAQQELLVFVEESVLDDEESSITNVGREPMFVMLKTVVDALVLD
ncbi:MAG: hypothetical protein KA010_02970 [Saprospiraceae bacterium]|nr:hypothetical protein [Saprospiraceae bacterium]